MGPVCISPLLLHLFPKIQGFGGFLERMAAIPYIQGPPTKVKVGGQHSCVVTFTGKRHHEDPSPRDGPFWGKSSGFSDQGAVGKGGISSTEGKGGDSFPEMCKGRSRCRVRRRQSVGCTRQPCRAVTGEPQDASESSRGTSLGGHWLLLRRQSCSWDTAGHALPGVDEAAGGGGDLGRSPS